MVALQGMDFTAEHAENAEIFLESLRELCVLCGE